MILSSRTAELHAYRAQERALTALFEALSERIGGILLATAGPDGTIPLQDGDMIRRRAREIVETYFVQRVPLHGNEYNQERAHLSDMIDRARQELRDAPTRQTARIRGRLAMLTTRLALLAGGGVALWAFRRGQPSTDYARIVTEGTESAITAALAPHIAAMRRILQREPVLLRWLEGGSVFSDPAAAVLRALGSVLDWQDTRGYRLSDRIWQVGETTAARIDALLQDGIVTGRSAVDIADDLAQFLKPARRGVLTATPYPPPYGTVGSFDARRLARTELARAHSLATVEAGITNPFVTRARWNLSRSHDPSKCDGTCDAYYAQDRAQGGFAPTEVPVPVDDSHPQCLCYVTHETGSIPALISVLRDQYMATTAQPAPITPLAAGLMVPYLFGRRAYATPADMAESEE